MAFAAQKSCTAPQHGCALRRLGPVRYSHMDDRRGPGSRARFLKLYAERGRPPSGLRQDLMRGALGGPRVLLRRLREVMAEPVSAQERLDKVVVLIAANMVAEVCSVYVLRVDGTLELYATEGLKREAVHQTVMRTDEGLVGLVGERSERGEPVGGAYPPRLRLPAGNRGRNLPFIPWRAGAARRQYARRPGGAEPRAPHLLGRRGRGAPDHRHGARRNDRVG